MGAWTRLARVSNPVFSGFSKRGAWSELWFFLEPWRPHPIHLKEASIQATFQDLFGSSQVLGCPLEIPVLRFHF